VQPLYATNTSQHKQHFFMNILCTEFFCPQKLWHRYVYIENACFAARKDLSNGYRGRLPEG
jgi:hypothetical protein